ncbi:MAG: hypothetical protein U9Q33_09460 [Campylobacterota bacterium]|nr:hypothetical protein [Campylobacterota bacterium]
MLRQIILPTEEHYDLHIPKEYLNHEVEILVLPFSYSKEAKEIQLEDKDIFKKTAGILKSKNVDPLKWQEDIRSDREI